ncbi:MAG: hypothetical protein AB7S42_11545 [Lysobacteraceae bacterium]
MSIILHDCRQATPIERLREYAARVDPTTPEHRGRVIRGVRLQARFRSIGAPSGSLTPTDADAAFFDPPSPFDLFGPDFTPLSHADLSKGF